MNALGVMIFVVLWSLPEILSVAGDQVVGLGSFGALIEAVVGFVFGNL